MIGYQNPGQHSNTGAEGQIDPETGPCPVTLFEMAVEIQLVQLKATVWVCLFRPGPARTLGKLGWRGKGFWGRIVSCDIFL
ncbi:MAG: hypothetical protein JW955_07030, partial [Sedimentisphaerales bacterium]|nr:hypothetical protein [Sedimentisphaerales bacterium]